MGLSVKAEVAKEIRKGGMRASVGVYGALDKRIAQMILAAAERAKANGRTTVLAQDV